MNARDILAHREQRELSAMQEKMLAHSWDAFSKSLAGKDLLEKLDAKELEALRAIEDCDDYREATELVIRYQQRRLMCQIIRNYIRGQIESLEERNQDEYDADRTDDTSYS